MGIQEMLLHFHPLFALFIIPALMLIALFALPYINYQLNSAGVWFASYKGRSMASVAALVALLGTPLGILADEYLIEVAVPACLAGSQTGCCHSLYSWPR
jgi:hypothetical protein